jgi:hypothetical protein
MRRQTADRAGAGRSAPQFDQAARLCRSRLRRAAFTFMKILTEYQRLPSESENPLDKTLIWIKIEEENKRGRKRS